jgi:mannosyltransferase
VPPAAVALPWLVVPPVVLVAASQASPMYNQRYVVYCLPALAVAAAAGLAWLARVTARATAASPAAAWLPALAVAAGLALALVPPQEKIRLPSSRADNLRLASTIVAAHERPGDAVFYLPRNMRVLGMGYPAPFRRLRDVALARTPMAAGNLIGISVSPAVLRQRFAGVTRVWLVTGLGGQVPAPRTPLDRAGLALLAGWRLAGRWQAQDVLLSLYARR